MDHVNELKSNGYSILKSKIDVDLIKKIRKNFIQDMHAKFMKQIEPVLWNSVLGEKNRNGYDDDQYQKMLRRFSYTWNESDVFDSIIRDILDQADSAIDATDLKYLNKRVSTCASFGTYDTLTYYSSDGGWLYEHVDAVSDEPNQILMQVIVPLTFKGKHYSEGGLYVKNMTGKITYLDDHVNEGDIMVLNGSFKHGVHPISSESSTGRLHVFRIATVFENPIDSQRFISEVPLSKYIKSKMSVFKRKIKKLVAA